jgi:hypothetical protein
MFDSWRSPARRHDSAREVRTCAQSLPLSLLRLFLFPSPAQSARRVLPALLRCHAVALHVVAMLRARCRPCCASVAIRRRQYKVINSFGFYYSCMITSTHIGVQSNWAPNLFIKCNLLLRALAERLALCALALGSIPAFQQTVLRCAYQWSWWNRMMSVVVMIPSPSGSYAANTSWKNLSSRSASGRAFP